MQHCYDVVVVGGGTTGPAMVAGSGVTNGTVPLGGRALESGTGDDDSSDASRGGGKGGGG